MSHFPLAYVWRQKQRVQMRKRSPRGLNCCRYSSWDRTHSLAPIKHRGIFWQFNKVKSFSAAAGDVRRVKYISDIYHSITRPSVAYYYLWNTLFITHLMPFHSRSHMVGLQGQRIVVVVVFLDVPTSFLKWNTSISDWVISNEGV